MAPQHDPSLAVLLTRLSKAFYRRSTETLLGIRLKDYTALSSLRDGRLPQQTLAESLHVDENNLVLLLNEMEESELVSRRRDPEDRRRHIVEITPRGRKALERAEAGMATLEDEVLAGLTATERATLKRLVRRALESQVRAPKDPETART